MAPARLQCLNSMRTVSRNIPCLKATFSTSSVARAVENPEGSPSTDGIPISNSERDFGHSNAAPSINPIQLPLNRHQRSGPTNKNAEPRPESVNRVLRLVDKSFEQKRRQQAEKSAPNRAMEDLQKHKLAANLTKQISRRFHPGDVYAPHDLSAVEMEKWRRKGRPVYDAFDALDLNPIDHYRNFSIISEYMTPMGRIMHSKDTGLRPVNQRRIARTIRRTIGMGMMPSVHRHPEILQKLLLNQNMRGNL